MSDYPEHDKAESVQAESQAIGDFLEWLAGPPHGILLAKFRGDQLTLAGIRFELFIAEHMGIDYAKLQREKADMLNEIRKVQA